MSATAARRRAVNTRRLPARATVAALWVLLLVRAASGADTPDAPAGDSSTEINRKVTNPLSTTWSFKVINKVTFRDVGSHGDHPQYTLQLQPIMPVWLSTEWKLIARPEFTFVDDTPYTNSQGDLHRTTGLGDTILDLVLSPQLRPWLIALGSTFTFPTANLDQTGMGKWQAGPAGVVGYQAKRWTAYLIAQQWWSFAGSSSRPAQNHLNLQYVASYFFGDGWSIGTSPTIKFDWRATDGKVTFPIGPTLGKVIKAGGVPVKLELQGVYMPVYPDANGDRFAVELQIIPVVPAPIEGPLLR